MFEKRQESKQASVERRFRNIAGNGNLVVDEKDTTKCDILVALIEHLDFTLVCFQWQERRDRQNLSKTYYNLTFTFAKELRRDAHPVFVQKRVLLYELFVKLCNRSFWGVRIYDNPLFVRNEQVAGRRSCSITLGNRRSKQEKAWRRDGKGKKVGDAPALITPKCSLRLKSNSFILLTNEGSKVTA